MILSADALTKGASADIFARGRGGKSQENVTLEETIQNFHQVTC
jgi:hypothetical protein